MEVRRSAGPAKSRPRTLVFGLVAWNPNPPEGIVSATRMVSASAERIFDLIADPSIQPSWDGNNNLASAAPGQRVHQVGDVFKTTLTNGAVRENHVVEFIEGSQDRLASSRTRKAAARPPLALGGQPDQLRHSPA